jgi:hypothetical protein
MTASANLITYKILDHNPHAAHEIEAGARQLAPTGASLVTCWLGFGRTGLIAYSAPVGKIRDRALREFLAERCRFSAGYEPAPQPADGASFEHAADQLPQAECLTAGRRHERITQPAVRPVAPAYEPAL